MPPEIRAVLVAAALIFVCYRIYSRVRSNIGRQPLQPAWLIIRTVIFLASGGLVLVLSAMPMSEIALYAGGGGMAGALIALYALNQTKVERTERGYFYTGHPYIGLAIVGLFVGRLVFVLGMVLPRRQEIAAQMHAQGGSVAQIMAQTESGTLTLGIFGLLVTYYVVFSLGLFLKAR